uniref:Uncharacterized protein n=1 Tax=viral metagenome TaxID=1070528 RepID=A0A6C0C8M4_9ZZZZ
MAKFSLHNNIKGFIIFCITVPVYCVCIAYILFGISISIFPNNNRYSGCPGNEQTCDLNVRLLCSYDNMYPCYLVGIILVVLSLSIIMLIGLLFAMVSVIVISVYDLLINICSVDEKETESDDNMILLEDHLQ